MQTTLIPVAYTKGTKFKPAPREHLSTLELHPDSDHFFYRMLLPLPAGGEFMEKQAKVLATMNSWLEQPTN
jgi:hypothetical protein